MANMHAHVVCSFELENVFLYGHSLVCVHGITIILTNYEPSGLVAERIFCTLQVKTPTI